jgi:hypothetical protein
MLLAGCTSLHVMSHVPLATMSRLSSMKLAEIDPAHLRVAARMPAYLEPRRGGVTVSITIGAKDAAKTELVLEPATEPSERSALSKFQRPGSRLWSYRLSSADAARLQQAIRAADGGQTSTTIAAGVDACRRGPLGSEPLPTTTYLRTDASGFFVLAEDLDLRSVVSERDLASKVPACE